MAKALSNLQITEISLVDDPANEDAKVAIFKSKAGGKCEKCGTELKKDGSCECEIKKGGEDEPADTIEKINEQAAAIMRHIPAALEECAQLLVEKAAAAGGIPADSVAALNAVASLKEYTMDIQELSAALETAEAKLATLEKRATDAEAALTAKDEEMTVLKAAAATPATEEDVIKSLPEPVQKMLSEQKARAEEAEAAVAKMRDEKETAEFVAKAKELKFGDPAQIGPLLQRIAKGKSTDDDAKIIETLLKQAGAGLSGSKLFESLGDGNGDAADPEKLLKAKAEEIRKANSSLTPEQAYSQALEKHPELYNAYLAKRRAA